MLSPWAQTILEQKYLHEGESSWEDVATRVVTSVMGEHLPDLVPDMVEAVASRKFMPAGRFLANAGRSNFNNNCFLMRCVDSKEGIADLYRKMTVTSMSGGGVGVVWSDLRPRGATVSSNGGTSTGPTAFMQSVNEIGRGVVNGGSRRAAIWAGLHWWHPDVFEFMSLKDWPDHIVQVKETDFSAYAPMDMTNISVILDDDFFQALNDPNWNAGYVWTSDDGEVAYRFVATHEHALKVYWTAVEKMLSTGEPGFSVDTGVNVNENLRNPCTEVTSEDDSDICCLGSINLGRVDTVGEFERLVELGTAFLLCGTLVSEVPYEEVKATREKNRRLGLGLMGVYEWLVKRGYRYEPNDELGSWLSVYQDSDAWAAFYADLLGVSRPVKTRAIAPTGTIGILAETTTGIEPLFAVAYKRRYLTEDGWRFQYVVEPTAQRLINEGADPDVLETAYDLAADPGRRLAMQVFFQRYVDHAISSTLNLPAVEAQPFGVGDFGYTLLEHLEGLRGVTVYPDGARGGQPLTVVSYWEAVGQEGVEFDEVGSDMSCVNGVCGI